MKMVTLIKLQHVTTNSDGYNICKTRIEVSGNLKLVINSHRVMDQGTIGMIYNAEDMPFSSNGIIT